MTLTLALMIGAYGITIAALTLLAIRVRQLIGIYKKGAADPTRSGNRGARLKNMLKETLGHTKMLNFTATGIAHWFVMIGFGALFGTLIQAYFLITNQRWGLPVIGHLWPYEYFVELITWLTGVSIVTLIGIRQFTRFFHKGRTSRFLGSGNWKAYYVEATILAIVFCVIALRGLEGALSEETARNKHYITTWWIAEMFKELSLGQITTSIQVIAAVKIFVSMLWFVVLGALGLWHVIKNPFVLHALNPLLGVELLVLHPKESTILLGSVVLAITGVEALYADMGHFGRRAINTGWYAVVLPGLTLNYFGQGANVIAQGGQVGNPFLALAPEGPLRLALLALSICADIIASQALISGAYSLIRQAIQLGYFPRLTIKHTNPDQPGQIYLPLVNITLALGAIATVYGFKSSSALAAAYGIAVTATMIVTSLILFVVMRRAWLWPRWQAFLLCLLFIILDVTFFGANIHKFADGGWLPVFIALGLLAIMTTWKLGKAEIFRRIYANEITMWFTRFGFSFLSCCLYEYHKYSPELGCFLCGE